MLGQDRPPGYGILSPTAMRALADRVNASMVSMHRDVWHASAALGEFRAQWKLFFDAWTQYYTNLSWVDFWFGSTATSIQEYEVRLRDWYNRFVALGGAPTGPRPFVPTGPSLTTWLVLGALLVGGVVLLVYAPEVRALSPRFRRSTPEAA